MKDEELKLEETEGSHVEDEKKKTGLPQQFIINTQIC